MGKTLKAGYSRLDGMGLNILTDDELDAIHCATLDVLQNSGIKVPSKEAQEIFDGGGCEIDRKNDNVKIPPYLVEDALRSAPSTFWVYGRNRKNRYLCGDDITFTNFGEAVYVIDLFSKERRGTTKKDVGNVARVCDYLDQDVCVKAVGANEMPPEVKTIHMAEEMFTNTSKPIFIGGGNPYNVRKAVEMASACVGGMDSLREKPIYIPSFCPNSPLTLNEDLTDPVIEIAKDDIPIRINCMPMSGATAPITLAGTLVIHNTEVLSAITLIQLLNKGNRVIYGSSALMYGIRSNCAPVGTPEMAMLNAAIAKLARFYMIPSFTAGG